MASAMARYPTQVSLTHPGVRVMDEEFEKFDDFGGTYGGIYEELPNDSHFYDGCEALVGVYKPSIAGSIVEMDDHAYDRKDVWKTGRVVIARFKRDDMADWENMINWVMHNDQGFPEIILMALPWNAGRQRMSEEDLTTDGTLAPFLQINDWSSVHFVRDLRLDENGLTRDLTKVWRAVRAWLIEMEDEANREQFWKDDEFPVQVERED